MWMLMWIVVSNTNDPVGGDRGCGNRSLYRIQMIMVVTSIEEELDCCIKYKQSCEEEEMMVVVGRKEWSIENFLYLLSFNEVTCCHHVTHATAQTRATRGGVLNITSGAHLLFP